MSYPIGEWVPCMISGAQWFMRLRGLERDPQSLHGTMLESSTTSRNNYSTNLMVIEFAFDSASAM